MKNDKIKSIVKKVVENMQHMEESDLLAPDKMEWNNMKTDLKKRVEVLLQNIEDDNYQDAAGDIDKVRTILKVWKYRISKSL